jgi:hypothetical protein
MDELELFCMSLFDELNKQLCIQRLVEAAFQLADNSLGANDSPVAHQDRVDGHLTGICQASEQR